jgi:hypothetical protein
MGGIFERMCIEYLGRLNGTDRLPFPFFEIGRWWGTDPKEKRQVEIDIVATYEQEKKALFCECKFRRELLGLAVVDSLIKKCALLSGYDDRHYYAFSLSGFAAGVRDDSPQNVHAIDLDALYECGM